MDSVGVEADMVVAAAAGAAGADADAVKNVDHRQVDDTKETEEKICKKNSLF